MRCIESLKDTSIMTTNMTIIIMIIKYKKNSHVHRNEFIFY